MRKNLNKRGFTLVEMLVAVSLFIIVVSISIGALLSILDANRKTRTSKTVVDNLNLSIEDMTRVVRFSTNYYCGVSNNLSEFRDCSNGGNAISVSSSGDRVVYSWAGTENDPIRKSENGGVTYTNITAPEVKIEHLRFYVLGSDSSDVKQPYVVAVISGYVGSDATTKSTFSIQTLMSQRALDI
jgi:type II secretory pathway pseudopilin PulG